MSGEPMLGAAGKPMLGAAGETRSHCEWAAAGFLVGLAVGGALSALVLWLA